MSEKNVQRKNIHIYRLNIAHMNAHQKSLRFAFLCECKNRKSALFLVSKTDRGEFYVPMSLFIIRG